jgi:glycosyltransferase involved in cell wall biosynthesis
MGVRPGAATRRTVGMRRGLAPTPIHQGAMRILAVIPCYNEADSLPSVVAELASHCPEVDLVVIDDGSTDDTYRSVPPVVPVVRLLINLGIGGAVQTGLKYALYHDYDLVVQIDGDGQHPPDQIGIMLERYKAAPVNILIGSRFLQPGGFSSTFLRRQGILLIRWTLYALYGRQISDPTSGLRLMDRQAIALFSREYPHDYPEPISIAYALEQGLTVAEVPVKMRARLGGKSTISGIKSVFYMVQVVGYILLARARRILG